jgi:transcription elongation factor GreA
VDPTPTLNRAGPNAASLELRLNAQILYNFQVFEQSRARMGWGRFGSILKLQMVDLAEKIKKKLKDEIATLEHELHDELPKEIKVARAHGDLSENAEYKYAKERQGYVAARLAQLHQRMADLSMLNLNNLPKDRAAYGSRLVVLDIAKETKIEYKLVTVEEADAAKGLISTTSPIGRALLGKKVGDEVKVTTPAGLREYEVVELVTIYDEE